MTSPTARHITLPTGVTLNCYQVGQGPDVLLLHGITGCGLYWSEQITALVNAGYRVTAPDGRGHGTSSRAGSYLTADISADAAALIVALGLQKPIVIGHSMGGAQAMHLVCTHPELVSKVILEDPAFWPFAADDARIAEIRTPWEAGLRQWLTMSHDQLVAFKRSEAPHWSDDALNQWAYAKLHNDPLVLQWLDGGKEAMWAWFRPVDVPVLLLYCEPEKGGVIPAELVAALHERMPSLRGQIIPAVGHEMHHDNPAAFTAAVLAFMHA
ncbi:MAG: alpha/beta fold hydrolase [Roseiflexaceae bacterium]|jgi:pimeloyl-ACP methyl ester carboxylesterase